MDKEYFRIGFAQMKLNLGCDNEKEFLIADDLYFKQMDEVVEKIDDCDVVIFPELSYHKHYEDYFLTNSNNKIFVFGSCYVGNENFTVVYHNMKKYVIKKMFNSPVEPSIRYQQSVSVKEFLRNNLKERTLVLNGKKFIVLNCAEYYKVAYFIARDEAKSKNLFGFLVPCANNNNEVFLTESKAISNHNDRVYSFIVNSNSLYNNAKYSLGGSYVFGKVSPFERECVKDFRLKEANNICCLDDGSYFVSGMYLYKESSNYYRSDSFRHTPKNIRIERIGKENEKNINYSRTNK